ncbi:MAG: ABC transporter permease, partial [Bradyrhizobium sp.]
MGSGESVTVSAAGHKRSGRIAALLRSQMRNIAPFLTLILLSGFFAAASSSFATLDNVGNILTQVSVTGIIAVGLTFVI